MDKLLDLAVAALKTHDPERVFRAARAAKIELASEADVGGVAGFPEPIAKRFADGAALYAALDRKSPRYAAIWLLALVDERAAADLLVRWPAPDLSRGRDRYVEAANYSAGCALLRVMHVVAFDDVVAWDARLPLYGDEAIDAALAHPELASPASRLVALERLFDRRDLRGDFSTSLRDALIDKLVRTKAKPTVLARLEAIAGDPDHPWHEDAADRVSRIASAKRRKRR